MNERIKELAQRATDIVETFNPDTGINHHREFFNQEKFAELIVRECARVADLADENKCEWIGGNILTHFGVK
jgi:hypothetical protein